MSPLALVSYAFSLAIIVIIILDAKRRLRQCCLWDDGVIAPVAAV